MSGICDYNPWEQSKIQEYVEEKRNEKRDPNDFDFVVYCPVRSDASSARCRNGQGNSE